jgi:ADP-heptose:LPS heptosyltransferase
LAGESKYQYTKNILVVTIDDLSEILCAVPFISNLKSTWSEKKVDVLAAKKYRSLLGAFPFIDTIKDFDDGMGFMGRIKFFQSLAGQYDLVVSFTSSLTGFAAAYLSKAHHRVGIVTKDPIHLNYVGKYLLTAPVIVDYSIEADFNKKFLHEVELGFKLADELGIKTHTKDIIIETEAEDISIINNLVKKWNISPEKKIFCLHLSDSWLTQNWEVKDFYKLIDSIVDGFPEACVILMYNANNFKTGREISGKYANHSSVKSTGELKFIQQLELIKRCFCVVTFDRYTMQLAASVNIPVIAVYPPKNSEVILQRWAPWRVDCRKLIQKIPSQLINEIYSSIKDIDRLKS